MDKYLKRIHYFSNNEDLFIHSVYIGTEDKHNFTVLTDVNVNLFPKFVSYEQHSDKGIWYLENDCDEIEAWSHKHQTDPDLYGLPPDEWDITYPEDEENYTETPNEIRVYNRIMIPLMKPFHSRRYSFYIEQSQMKPKHLLEDGRWVLETYKTIMYCLTLFYLSNEIVFPLEMINNILHYLRPIHFIPPGTPDHQLEYGGHNISKDAIDHIRWQAYRGISTWNISHYKWENNYSREKMFILNLFFSLKRILGEKYDPKISETILKYFLRKDLEPRMENFAADKYVKE